VVNPATLGPGGQEDAYLNSGNAFRESGVAPDKRICLSTTCTLPKGTATKWVPRPRKPPTDSMVSSRHLWDSPISGPKLNDVEPDSR
jgi:hypothetical protein